MFLNCSCSYKLIINY